MLDSNLALRRTTLSDAHIDPRGVREFIGASLAGGADLHSVVIVRDGQLAFSAAFDPYQEDDPCHVYSVSKSWTVTAVGIAVDEGRFSLTDKVISFFPEDCPAEISENLAAMEVRHLLCMGTGHDTEPSFEALSGDNWEKVFLSHPVLHRPGSKFVYNSMASYMLSAIVQKTTGEDLVTYLTPRLFEPLGITRPIQWTRSPKGVCCGGWGIHVTAEELAKLGLVYLNGGVFNGKRILSEKWVREATAAHIDNSQTVGSTTDWHQGYCWQMWRCQHDCFRFDGAFGQFMVAIPQKNAVVAILSNTINMQCVLDAIWNHLLPAFDREASEPEPGPYSCPLPELEGRPYQQTLDFPANKEGLRAFRVSTNEDGGVLRFSAESEEISIPFGRTRWEKAVLPFCPFFPDMLPNGFRECRNCAVGIAGGWRGDKLLLTVRYRNIPHTLLWIFDSRENTLTVRFPEHDAMEKFPPLLFTLTPRA